MNHNPSPATRFGGPRGNKPAGGNRWRKEDTPRYKLERLITLTKAEVQAIIDDTTAPLFDRQISNALMHADWNMLERTINQVYGPPVQRIEQRNIPAPIPLLDLDAIKAKAKMLNTAQAGEIRRKGTDD
jgi:hypothetical protein